MDGIMGMNPNGKTIGLLNAAIQQAKHTQKDLEGAKPANPAQVNNRLLEKDFELTIEYGGKNTKLTYSKEDLMKNVVTINDESQPENTQSVIHLNLNLSDIMKESTSISSTEQITALETGNKIVETLNPGMVAQPPNLNPLQLELLTADSLEMNIALQVGNDIIMVGNNTTATFRTTIEEDNGQDIFIIGNNSSVNFESKVGVDNSDDVTIIGNNSEVNISSEVNSDNGNDIMIIGNNSRVNLKESASVHNGNDTVIMGNNSELVFEGNTGMDNGNDTIILGNNTRLIYKGSTGIDNGNDTIILGNGAQLVYEGSTKVDNGDTTFIIGHHVKIDIKINIDEDKESSILIAGKNTEKILDEVKRMGVRLKKFRIGGGISLKDFLDKIIKQTENALKNFKKFKNLNSFNSDDKSGFSVIQLSLYRHFNRQLAGIEVIYSYANKQYKKNTPIGELSQAKSL